MIRHLSMPADDCALVARVLAEILDGGALRFPPGGPDAWNCWSRDNGFQIVVTPRGRVLVPGPIEQEWVAHDVVGRASESHFAISVERSAEEIMSIAKRVGWQARLCDRGGMFGVVELWVENAFLVEVLDPAQSAAYRRTMTVDNWTRAFAL
jgi:hypothetical protein